MPNNLGTIPDAAIILSGRGARAGYLAEWERNAYTTFAGTDIVVTATYPGTQSGETITLGELQTLSYSIHRENAPVRELGHVSPVGFIKGSRTIAGSMVWTNFNHYGWYRIERLKEQINKGNYPIADMLPPLDITVTFANEFGKISGLRVMGVTFTDEGMTMSVDDLIIESVVNYMARNIQPIVAVR